MCLTLNGDDSHIESICFKEIEHMRDNISNNNLMGYASNMHRPYKNIILEHACYMGTQMVTFYLS